MGNLPVATTSSSAWLEELNTIAAILPWLELAVSMAALTLGNAALRVLMAIFFPTFKWRNPNLPQVFTFRLSSAVPVADMNAFTAGSLSHSLGALLLVSAQSSHSETS